MSEPHPGRTFLTNHARVPAAIADRPAAIADNRTALIRDIAARRRPTGHAAQEIIDAPERDGYPSRTREGRGNTHRIEPGKMPRHPAGAGPTAAAPLSPPVRDEAHRTRGPGPGVGGARPGRIATATRTGRSGRSTRAEPNAVAAKRDQGHEYVSDI